MSGNTGATSNDPAVTGAAWTQPQPQAVLGLSSSMIYGSSFSSSVPSNLQLTTGGQVKICLDPVGLAKSLIPGLSSLPNPEDVFFGPGVNGNIQLTLGSYANILLGQAYNLHLGPKEVKPNFGSGLSAVLAGMVGGLIGAFAIILQIAYGLHPDDDHRANLVVVFQLLLQALLGALVTIGDTQYNIDNGVITTFWDLYKAKNPKTPPGLGAMVMLGATAIGLFELIEMPLTVSTGESKLDQLVEGKPGGGGGQYVSATSQNPVS